MIAIGVLVSFLFAVGVNYFCANFVPSLDVVAWVIAVSAAVFTGAVVFLLRGKKTSGLHTALLPWKNRAVKIWPILCGIMLIAILYVPYNRLALVSIFLLGGLEKIFDLFNLKWHTAIWLNYFTVHSAVSCGAVYLYLRLLNHKNAAAGTP